jgi:hypothetical protein
VLICSGPFSAERLEQQRFCRFVHQETLHGLEALGGRLILR